MLQKKGWQTSLKVFIRRCEIENLLVAVEKTQEAVMDKEKVKEIISILMESPFYFDLSLIERVGLIRKLISLVHCV